MLELTGRVIGLTLDYKTRKANLTLEINEKNDIFAVFDKLKELVKLSIKITKFRKKRSLNANAYAWQLMSEIAEDQGITKEEVYRHHIKEVGVCREVEVRADAVDALERSWGLHGLGWLSERLDYGRREGFVLVMLYDGSSTYNTKQMSRLIENIVQDCKALGIQTKTPDEIRNMLNLWETERAA